MPKLLPATAELGSGPLECVEYGQGKPMQFGQVVDLDRPSVNGSKPVFTKPSEHAVYMHQSKAGEVADFLLRQGHLKSAILGNASEKKPTMQFEQHRRDALFGVPPAERDQVIVQAALVLAKLERQAQRWARRRIAAAADHA
jgi:hypothetical protein